MIALMLMASSFTDSEYTCLNYYWNKDPRYQISLGQNIAEASGSSAALEYDFSFQVVDLVPEYHAASTFDEDTDQVCALSYGQTLSMIGPDEAEFYRGSTTYLSTKDVRRWKYAAMALRKIPGFNTPTLKHAPDPLNMSKLLSVVEYGSEIPNALVSHVSDVPDLGYGCRDFVLPDVLFDDVTYWCIHVLRKRRVLVLMMVVLPLIYGGVHLTVESIKFGSYAESLLWRIACVDVMSTFPVVFLLLDMIFNLDFRILHRFKVTVVLNCPHVPAIVLAIVFFFHGVSRVYIVVEAFISLRYLPNEVHTLSP